MAFTVLVLSACLVDDPNKCKDMELVYADDISPMQCVMGAQPEIAKWVEEHPKWTVKKWKCKTQQQQVKLDKPI
jgi:hypothetical protein